MNQAQLQSYDGDITKFLDHDTTALGVKWLETYIITVDRETVMIIYRQSQY